jgi:hypothetical protein
VFGGEVWFSLATNTTGNSATREACSPQYKSPYSRRFQVSNHVPTLLTAKKCLISRSGVSLPSPEDLIELSAMNKLWQQNVEKYQKRQICDCAKSYFLW